MSLKEKKRMKYREFFNKNPYINIESVPSKCVSDLYLSWFRFEWIQQITTEYPLVLGKTIKEAWPSQCDFVSSLCESVRTKRKGWYKSDEYIETIRNGYREEVYFDYTYSPIFKSDGTVCGIINISQETTQRVLNDRRLKTITEIGYRISEVTSLESACYMMTKVLSDNNADIPYSLIYFIEQELNDSSKSLIARLITTTFDDSNKKGRHIPDYFPETHEIIDLAKDADKSYDTYIVLKRMSATYSFLKCKSWPMHLAIKKGHVKVLLKDKSQAVLLSTKISLCEGKVLFAVLICGVNRCRVLDEKYMEYFQLVINQMNKYLLYGASMEEEKKRTKILADLNRQKVTFFQGISHELKTPLTLMLSPLDDVINVCSQETQIMSHLQIVRRNARRLLKLINVLLQFSNIETDQLEAHYCETNIAKFTQELALEFEYVAKKLGLDYVIDIPYPDEFNQALNYKIYLDHDMYETIVFNLCKLECTKAYLECTHNHSIIYRLQRREKDNSPRKFVQPQFIGAYPDQRIVEQVLPEEEINLRKENFEEINLVGILEELEGIQEEANYQADEPEGEVLLEPKSETTIEELEPERNMAEDALTAAAETMTTLTNALGQGGEKSLLKIDFYRGDGTQNPVTWLEELERAAKANHWSPARQLKLALDPTGAFPEAVIIQFFIQGLQPEYAMNVQAAKPAELDDTITEARKWETAIEHLTEQIAKFSINLAEKQAAPSTPTQENLELELEDSTIDPLLESIEENTVISSEPENNNQKEPERTTLNKLIDDLTKTRNWTYFQRDPLTGNTDPEKLQDILTRLRIESREKYREPQKYANQIFQLLQLCELSIFYSTTDITYTNLEEISEEKFSTLMDELYGVFALKMTLRH
ncbi:hypothetical protein C2G38_2195754 [Gigaspora rosea]|uniref:Signal transduction histidine kinase dimerisation/phosphoacceptor domain-containing protein n=1 Tax=Gigaspora rosea TaxID=44941 RepID=A0A397UVE4_9GLOM|nr:hypothetical protein C2G38_2195754 [Gigaspora rosea]